MAFKGPTLDERFPAAATGKPPTPEQRAAVAELQAAHIKLGELIELHVPEGRNQSLSLTALEDSLMRANKGIFTEGVTS